jgi:hypothetical protein
MELVVSLTVTVRFELLCTSLSRNQNMIWPFVMPLSVGRTIQVGRETCRQQTYKKQGVITCPVNDSKTENMAPCSGGVSVQKRNSRHK